MDELEGQFEHEAWQVVVKNSMGMEAVEYLHQIGATTLKHLTQLDDEDFAALFDKKKAWKKTFIESVQQAWNAQDTAFSSPSDPSGTATPSSHLSTSGTASHFDRPFAVDKVQRNHGGERPPEHVCPLGATLFRKDFQKEFTYAGKTFQGGYLPPEADMLLDTHNGEGGLCGKQWRTVICCTAWWIGLPFAFVWDRIPRDAPVRELDCRIQISTGMTKDDMQACGYTTYNSLKNKMNDIRKGKGVNMGFPPSIESFFQQQDPRIPQLFLEAYLQRRGEAPGAFAKMMADVLGNAQAVVDARVNSSLQKTAKILSTVGPEETQAPAAAAAAVQDTWGGGLTMKLTWTNYLLCRASLACLSVLRIHMRLPQKKRKSWYRRVMRRKQSPTSPTTMLPLLVEGRPRQMRSHLRHRERRGRLRIWLRLSCPWAAVRQMRPLLPMCKDRRAQMPTLPQNPTLRPQVFYSRAAYSISHLCLH